MDGGHEGVVEGGAAVAVDHEEVTLGTHPEVPQLAVDLLWGRVNAKHAEKLVADEDGH